MVKKKIGLAIVYKYPDYGSMLQALATQLTLTNLGYDSEAINTDVLQASINKRKYRYFAENLLDLTIVKEKSKIVKKKLLYKLDHTFGRNIRIREEAFKRFNKRYFKESKAFMSWGELSNHCRNYDSVLVGSDQLWLPSNIVGDYYTLSFVPDAINKVCYATSFGIGEVPPKYEEAYRKFLGRIQCLSARESSGQTIIQKMTGREVPLVCDPTLLMTVLDWDKIATRGRMVEEDYVFCYFMGDNPEHRTFAKNLAKVHHCKVVSLLHLDQYIVSDEKYADYVPYNISPADFISLIKHANYVCTDSFHGTVFSIIYSKDFFTFKRFSKKASLSTNTRIFSLLDRVNLSDRLFTAEEDAKADWHITNYDKIQEGISNFRAESLAYLTESLG